MELLKSEVFFEISRLFSIWDTDSHKPDTYIMYIYTLIVVQF